MAEKRKYMRFNVFLDAIYRTAGVLKRVKVDNFCREGVGILSSEPFKKGEDVKIEVTVPGDNIPVFFEGKIAWTNRSVSSNPKHKGGIRFKKVKNSDRSKILEYIYRNWVMPVKTAVK